MPDELRLQRRSTAMDRNPSKPFAVFLIVGMGLALAGSAAFFQKPTRSPSPTAAPARSLLTVSMRPCNVGSGIVDMHSLQVIRLVLKGTITVEGETFALYLPKAKT